MSEKDRAGLSLRNWSIRFDGVRALDKVSLDFPFGTITALLGENGSGKSTLVKILAGIHAAKPGATLEIDGQDVALPRVPADAAALGIGFLHQDLGLLDEASVAENMALAAGYGASRFGWVSRDRLAVRARKALAHIGLQIDVETPVGRLSMRDRTLVAFARTLASGEGGTRRVLVLDEPTASLAPADAAAVYEVIARVAQAGAAIILITHHLEEVVAVAERVAVLQAGRVAAALPAAGLSARDLARLMLDDAQWQEPERRQGSALVPSTRPALSIHGLRGVELDGVDFDVHQGEIVGLAGLRGAGLAELVAVLSGETTPKAGRLVVGGREIPVGDRAALLSAQVVVVPEDRRAKGVNLGFSIVDNLALGTGVREREARFRPLQRRREYQQAGGWIARLGIRPAAADRLVGGLSGGNQQKVALARALTLQPKVLLLDEPTQGVDVGARAVIAREVRHFAATGGAVLLASSNHEELLELSDRIIVLVRGRVVAELAAGTLTRASLLQAVGGDGGEATPSGGDHEDHSIIAAVSA